MRWKSRGVGGQLGFEGAIGSTLAANGIQRREISFSRDDVVRNSVLSGDSFLEAVQAEEAEKEKKRVMRVCLYVRLGSLVGER